MGTVNPPAFGFGLEVGLSWALEIGGVLKEALEDVEVGTNRGTAGPGFITWTFETTIFDCRGLSGGSPKKDIILLDHNFLQSKNKNK